MFPPSSSTLNALARALRLSSDELHRKALRIPPDIERWLLAEPGAIDVTRAMMTSPKAPTFHDAPTLAAPALDRDTSSSQLHESDVEVTADTI